MGNSDRGGFSAVPVERDSRFIPSGILGEITHTLSVAELAAHNHTGTTDGNNVDHTHGGGDLYDAQSGSTTQAFGSIPVVAAVNNTGGGNTAGESNGHAHGFTASTIGSSASHNNTPRTMLGTFYMKL
jgi:hypothetical protein